MSDVDTFDDLDGGDPDPAVVATADEQKPDDEEKPAETADEDEDDDLAVEVQQGDKRVKMAPVHRVIQHRKAAREAGARAANAERERDSLKQQLENASGDFAKISPLLNALKGRPDLVEAAMKGTRPSGPDHPANVDADPKMIQLAKDWEMYDADGKPDAARAARIAKTFKDDAKAEAEAKVAPLINAQVESRATANKGLLYGWAKQGHVTKEGVDKAIAMLPGAESLLAHDGVRDVLYFMAKGMSPAAAKAAVEKKTGDDVPIHTETAGGRGKAPVALPSFSAKIAERRGKTQAEWTKIRDVESDVLE